MVALAQRQHGVLARWQLLRAGVSRGAIERRVERGLLIAVHHGVYALGHTALRSQGRWMAAVLAGGPGGCLSHRSAAALWRLPTSVAAPLEVTFVRRLRPLPGVRRYSRRLPADERTVRDGIPVTTVPRTLFDLAAVTDRRHVARAAHEAERQRLTDGLSLRDFVERYPGHRGVATIRAILASTELGIDVTKDELELLFQDFVEERGLPRPLVNRPLWLGSRWIEPDCAWPEARVIVELDGRATHGSARSFESDRARDRRTHAAGWRVVRVTWRQLHAEREELAADLRALLHRGRAM